MSAPRGCDLKSRRGREGGFTLVGVMIILTVLAVVIANTVPAMWSQVMKREREYQTVWVMKQYARGIQEYQRKKGALPTSLQQLGEANTPRVMRQLYLNPLSGKLDWILIPPGTENQQGNIPLPNPQNRQFAQNPSGSPMPPPPGSTQPGQAGQPGPGGRPAGQVGPFVGVRPPNTGEALISLKGRDRYEEWSYTITDLVAESMPQQGMPGAPLGIPGATGLPNPQQPRP